MGTNGRRVAAMAAAWALAAAAPMFAQDVPAPRDTVPDTTRVAAPADSAAVVSTVPASTDALVDAARPEATITRGFAASPTLPFEHWAVQAARRAEAMGLTRFFPAQRAVPRAEVAAALAEAARNARSPALQRLVAGWAARFVEEFPEYGDGPRGEGRLALLGGEAAGGYDRWTGRLAPVVGYATSWQPPRPLGPAEDPRGSLAAGVAAAFGATGGASLSGEGVYRGGSGLLRQWDAAVGVGAFQLAVGRAQVGYGYGRMGSLVYADPDPLPRVELQSTRPFRLPGFFRRVGPVTLHTFAGPVNDPARHPTDPSLWGMRVAVQPHPRFTLGLNRGSMFGGSADPITAGRVLRMLVGIVHSDFENQVFSADARWRLPTDRVLPATAYLEWGADDAAGAMDEQPARVMGIFLPALPGAPQAGVGVEYAYFKATCCGHGPWYFNATLTGNWAVHGRPLGHPLGGQGSEYAAYAQGDLFNARLHLDGRGFVRDRAAYSVGRHFFKYNLYSPDRSGRSTGGMLDAALRLLPRADLRAGFTLENGQGWREESFHAALAWLF